MGLRLPVAESASNAGRSPVTRESELGLAGNYMCASSLHSAGSGSGSMFNTECSEVGRCEIVNHQKSSSSELAREFK